MSTMPSSITRRRFLATSTKAASAITAANLLLRPGRAPGAPRHLSPNEKLNIAFIGVAGRGGDNMHDITGAEDVNVVALCDVDENNLNRAGAKFPAEAGGTYILEASTNLVNWEMIGVAAPVADGQFEFEDSQAAKFPSRFYRVRVK